MRKASKMFVGLALAGMLLTGCNFPNNSQANSEAGVYEQQQIYQLYVANGGAKTYEEWLESVRGADGSTFLAGANDPAATDGKNGDIYVNITTWDFFLKISGAWNKLGNLKGAQGEKGDKGDKGDQGEKGEKGDKGEDGFDGEDGAPGADGKDGKDGKDGENGASVLTGSGAPAASLGKDGDSYIDIKSWDFYTKNNGKWKKVANLTGELAWAPEVAAAMNKYLGFQLPYADYDMDTIDFGYYAGYEDYYGMGLFYIYDESDDYSLEDYGDALLAAGFEEGNYYTSGNNYIKVVGEDVYEVSFFNDGGNCIHVYMPPYVPPMTPEYFLENGFTAIQGWPTANVDAVMGEGLFAGVNNDATWYELNGKYTYSDGSYYFYELLGTEGLFGDELAAQAIAAGFEEDDYYEGCFLKEDSKAEIDIIESDGNTLVKFFSDVTPAPDYTPETLAADGYELVAGWPADLIEETFGEEDFLNPVAEEADWFVKYTKNESTSEDKYYMSTKLATAGDVSADFGAELLAAGFTTSNGTSYSKPWGNNDSASVSVKFERGYTMVSIVGPWVYPNGAPLPPEQKTVDELNEEIIAFFAGKDLEVEVPDYVAADEAAYYEEASAGAYKIYKSNTDEMAAFADALDEAGWDIDYYSDWFEDDFKAYDASGAVIKVEDYYSYVKISLSVELPPEPPQVFNAFPYEELNEFLEDNDMDFEFTAEDAAAFAGAPFTLEYGTFSGLYPYACVSAAGDYEAAWKAIIEPIIFAADYEEKTDSQSGTKYYANADDHQISFDYEDGVTYVYFVY